MKTDATPVIITPDFLLSTDSSLFVMMSILFSLMTLFFVISIVNRKRILALYHLFKIRRQLKNRVIEPRDAAYKISLYTQPRFNPDQTRFISRVKYSRNSSCADQEFVSVINQLILQCIRGNK